MSQHVGRPPSSPLITPNSCLLIIIAPGLNDLNSLSRRARFGVRRETRRLLKAASLASVPCIVCSQCAKHGVHAFSHPLRKIAHQEIATGADGLPWQHKEFRQALAEHEQHVIVLAGFWLEQQIVSTTLHALAGGYDVYYVLDASPAMSRGATRSSQDRLIQAGATPVVASQVIHEWAIESERTGIAAALKALLRTASAHTEDKIR